MSLAISLGGVSNGAEWQSLLGWVDCAEALGLHSVWIPEMHFAPGVATSPLLTLAACAARTQNLRLATTSLLLPIRPPLRVAEEVAALDRLSQGRVILGLGRGFRAPLFTAFGIAAAGPVVAVREVSLAIAPAEYTAIMGPSGVGKSVTLKHAIGLLTADSGSVQVFDQEISEASQEELVQVRTRMGYVFQSFFLMPELTALENVMVPALIRGRQGKDRALELLDRVGLGARSGHLPNELSGGEQQRVAIARAIVGKPKILLADEPTGNLDSAMGAEVMGILAALNKNDDTTIIMVTHDEEKARRTGRIVRIFDGQLLH